MPYKSKEDRLANQKRHYARRRQWMFDYLGGKCVKCGKTSELEIDHIDPSEKSFALSKMYSLKKETLRAELAKCQLLCKDCHLAKTSVDIGVGHGEGKKGKRNCKCALCEAKRVEYMRSYNKHRRVA